jgi:hypothetical protein
VGVTKTGVGGCGGVTFWKRKRSTVMKRKTEKRLKQKPVVSVLRTPKGNFNYQEAAKVLRAWGELGRLLQKAKGGL